MSKCFTRVKNHIYAILNWPSRKHDNDALLCQQLTVEEETKYSHLKELGKTDSVIFNELFPEKIQMKRLISIEIAQLTKPQLIHLVNIRLKTSIPSLKQMSTEDLRCLLCKLDR